MNGSNTPNRIELAIHLTTFEREIPCALCEVPTESRPGPSLQVKGLHAPVCDGCGVYLAPELLELLQDAEGFLNEGDVNPWEVLSTALRRIQEEPHRTDGELLWICSEFRKAKIAQRELTGDCYPTPISLVSDLVEVVVRNSRTDPANKPDADVPF